MQSVNLRAALSQLLGEIKKDGYLGREVVVRKSMLDDCKGSKFIELLADFSTAVMRKESMSTMTQRVATPALKMSTATELSGHEYQLMVPLILAHRVSLGAKGRSRARIQATHDSFSRLLNKKKAEVLDRSMKGDDGASGREPMHSINNPICRDVKENWLGSEEWADALLYGGSQSSTDAFLELPFSEAWSNANEPTVEELKNGPVQDLVVNLESQISRQRRRLHRWHEISSSIRRENAPVCKIRSDDSTSKSLLAFRDHQSFSVAAASRDIQTRGDHVREQDMLSSLHEALARVNGKHLCTSHATDNLSLSPRARGC